MGNGASAAEMEMRTTQVYTMLVEGATRREILTYTAINYSISTRQTDTLINRANKRLKKDAETIRETELGKALTRLNTIYAKCMKVQDYRPAIAAQKEINTLLALYQKPPLDLTLADQLMLAQLLSLLAEREMSAGKLFNAMLVQIAASQEQTGNE